MVLLLCVDRQNSDFENNTFWCQVRERKTLQLLSVHFGHPHNAIFYRLELTSVLRNHCGKASIEVRIHTEGYQEGRELKSPLMAISCTLPTSLLSGEGCQAPAPSPLLLTAALCRASLGNNSPLVPSAGCQEELPAGKRESIIPQPLNISWVQCATRCMSAWGKDVLSLFSFHPPNHFWTTAVPITRFHVFSKSKVADTRNFSCVVLEKL